MLLDLEKFDLPSIAEAVVENMVISDQLSQTDSNKVLAALLLRHRHQHQLSPSMPRRPSSYNLMAMARKSSEAPLPVAEPEQKLSVAEDDGDTVDDGTIRLKIDDSCDDDITTQEISQVGEIWVELLTSPFSKWKILLATDNDLTFMTLISPKP